MAGKRNNDVSVKRVTSSEDLKTAQQIRYTVFVIGQHVPVEEEIDGFEDESCHFLAFIDNVPCGAARWRKTSFGVKLERFAVLDTYRSKGVGSALVQAVLDDIFSTPENHELTMYLHAQLDAVPLYEKFGFKKVGELFQECDIDHFKMVR